MPISAPVDTLAFQLSRPLTSQRSFADQACSRVAMKMNEFMEADEDEDTDPDGQALWFYALNHGMSLIAQKYAPFEPMDAEDLAFVNRYHMHMTEVTLRAAYYLILICVRESRHMGTSGSMDDYLDTHFGYNMRKFVRALPNGSDGAANAFKNNPPNCTIGQLAGGLSYLFHNGPFGGSFGGHPWGNVADCLSRFVQGEFSAEMMLDTNWTLCHNNGPIFNKGMLYKMYTGNLKFLLDAQRSGQIPELILENHDIVQGHVQAELLDEVKWIKARFPDQIGDYCDWYKAEALGAVNTLFHLQASQKQKYGPSVFATEAEKKKALEEAAAAALIAAKKKQEAAENFTIIPGKIVLKKFKPVRKVA